MIYIYIYIYIYCSTVYLYLSYSNLRDQYNEILMSEYCAQFEHDLEKDNYSPILVKDEESFRSIIREFPFYKRSMEQV
uniref:Exocyst complex subunit EXOC6/Sec15 C-terminal domain-containing protein n=1 Tax=Heterorhabditis bacteriophora TaxID=37862 RepID=A0A1I7X966_HETBA